MNIHTKPKPVTPPLAERIRIVENWRASSLSMSEFARQSDINVATLGYWNKEYTRKWRYMEDVARTMKGTVPAMPMIELKATRTQHPDEPDWRKLYEDEKAKVESLQKVIAVLGYQL